MAVFSATFAMMIGADLDLALAQAQDPEVRPPFIVEDPPKSAAEQQKLFHLPEGFQIELIASEPEVIKPINMSFDAAGRLFVSQSIEYPIPAPGERPGRDNILVIDDSNGDGVPDRTRTFADKLNIPIGVTPVRGGVLGFSVPKIYFFPDGDGDGCADGREVRFEEFGYDDTHGMVSSLTPWIDGWVYGCHGFVNTSNVAGADGRSITMTSGNTYRLRADGSRIERFAHGQVNPFGMAFDPWGNVFTADCHTRPATMLLRGAHYPRSQGDGLGLGPELMQHSHGSTGIAGLVYYAANQFPEMYRDSLFIGNPITGRINFDLLERHGSTYTAVEQPDFLTCDDPWFRPVDLKLGPDGALYIADFYNCIIGHYEVPLLHPKRDRSHGRIWRITYSGPDAERPASQVDLTHASAEELVDRLADPNLTIRTLATHQLVDRIGLPAIEVVRAVLHNGGSETQRAHGLWVLARLRALAPQQWRACIEDDSPLVRTHAVRALSEYADWDEDVREAVHLRLDDEEGFVRRAAVEALAQHPDNSSIRPLVELLAHVDAADACLVHAARMSLRDSLATTGTLAEWENAFANYRKGLQILADVAVGLPSADAAAFLWRRFQNNEILEDRRSDVLRHIVRFLDERSLNDVMTLAESYADRDASTQIAVAAAVHQGAQERGIPVPEAIRTWGEQLIRPLLTSSDPIEVERGISLAEQMSLSGMGEELVRLCVPSVPAPQRLSAVRAILTINPEAAERAYLAIMHDDDDLPALRQYVAEKLANLQKAPLRANLLDVLPGASQPVAVGLARGLAADRDGASQLLNLIEQGTVSRQVLTDRRVQRLLSAPGLESQQARMKPLIADLPSPDEALQRTIDERRVAFRSAKPDAHRGAEVFKKSCAVCHRLDNQGEKVGPELDGIGIRGVDRLLEDILDPSRTVDKNYRATVIVTENGQIITGLALREEGQVLLVADQLGKVHRVPLSEIDERRLLDGSAMPANLDEALPVDDLNALLAFLLTKTVKPAITRSTP